MPHRKGSITSRPPHAGRSFRQRYEELEDRRRRLLDRLNSLGDPAREHPGFRRASILLNQTFRNASAAQRISILQAAAWLIDVVQELTRLV